MWRFFAKDLGGQRTLFVASFVFFVIFLGGWFMIAPNAPEAAQGFFLWTLVVLIVQNSLLTSVRADLNDGTLALMRASHHHMGVYLLVRFMGFLAFGGALLAAASVLSALLSTHAPSHLLMLTWALSLPSVVALLMVSTCVSLGARHAGLLGPCLVLPLLLPLMMLGHMAQTLPVACAGLLCVSLTLTPLCLGASLFALKDEH
ncbi:MAG: hypothetical protein C0514_09155 [Candidatus Puniceispirillum sp.]|nr:hypothetical protein [Candidatus Puniceispirillum sp.]